MKKMRVMEFNIKRINKIKYFSEVFSICSDYNLKQTENN